MTFLDVFLWPSNAPDPFFFSLSSIFWGEETTFLPTFVLCALPEFSLTHSTARKFQFSAAGERPR